MTVARSRHSDMFPRREHGHNTLRTGHLYMEEACRTRRKYRSARPYLARLLNNQ